MPERLLPNPELPPHQSRIPSRLIAFLLFLILLFASLPPARPAEAQDARSELIEVINALRTSRGLDPYTVDWGLMAMAQEHSAYQASIHKSTHQHSDGNGPPQLGVVENVAGGDLGWIDPRACVEEIWHDPVHMRTMIGYAQGTMGVGIADDGVTAYYTLEVRPGDASTTGDGSATATASAGVITPIAPTPLVTMTPLPDGSIFHIVGYGQTLWSIALAYGVTTDQLRAWNNLAQGATEIYAGQRLLVRPASLAPSRTPTLAAAPTLSLSASPAAPSSPAATASPTLQAAGAVAQTGAPTALSAALEMAGTAEAQAAGVVAQENRRLLIPIIAGVSLLVGILLLVVVFGEAIRRARGISER